MVSTKGHEIYKVMFCVASQSLTFLGQMVTIRTIFFNVR
jgi:hypothetical protein